MKHYEEKRDILLNHTDLLKLVSKAKYKDFCLYDFINNGVIHKDKWHDLESALTMHELNQSLDYDIRIVFAEQIIRANTLRKTRLKKRIERIIKDALKRGLKVYFVTFTFSPELMAKTNEDTRRQYVRRSMSRTCIHFVGNIDFGVDERYTQREHYHAVVICSDLKELHRVYKEYTDSILYVEPIKLYANYTKTNYKLAKYISKLTNHAVKDSATYKRNCYIFDRNKEYLS